MDRQKDGQTEKYTISQCFIVCTDKQTDRQMDRQKDGQTGPGNYNIDELKTLLALFVKKVLK